MNVFRYSGEDQAHLVAALAEVMAEAEQQLVRVLVCAESASVSRILPLLQKFKIPYVAGSRWLFVAHPWIRLFLLGLRGLADDDPLGQACLLGRPFFPLGLEQRVQRVLGQRQMPSGVSQAWERAKETIRELRVRASRGGPGSAALALAEETAFLSHPSFFGANCETERQLFWMLLSAIERESWIASSDLVGFASTLHDWLNAPGVLAQKLQRSERGKELRLLAFEELQSGDAVDLLAVMAEGHGPSQIHWSLASEGHVRLETTDRRIGVDLQVASTLIVPDAGPATAGSISHVPRGGG